MGKKTTTILIVLIIIISILSFFFIPKEIIDDFGIFIFILPIIIIILIILIAIYLNSKKNKSTKKDNVFTKNVNEKLDKQKEEDKNKNFNNNSNKNDPDNTLPRRLQYFNNKSLNNNNNNNIKSNELKSNITTKKNPVSIIGLKKERDVIQDQIKIAEKKYLTNKIDNPTFQSVIQESNNQLIKIEANIDSEKNKDLSPIQMRKMQYISNDKQKALEELFSEKTNKVCQLRIAEKKYLKRKINEDMYKKIVSDVNKEIISIDSQIKALYKASEVDKIKQQLKESLIEVDKQKQLSKKRTEEQLEEDVLDQLPF
jgi:hypothetical protein